MSDFDSRVAARGLDESAFAGARDAHDSDPCFRSARDERTHLCDRGLCNADTACVVRDGLATFQSRESFDGLNFDEASIGAVQFGSTAPRAAPLRQPCTTSLGRHARRGERHDSMPQRNQAEAAQAEENCLIDVASALHVLASSAAGSVEAVAIAIYESRPRSKEQPAQPGQ